MRYTTLFFDLDDTLYASTNGLWNAIRDRMSLYMGERLGISETEVPRLRRYYYETYGTTLRGLQKHYEVDAEDYLAYVHDLPLEKFLSPNPALRSLLLSLRQGRWIFTNADGAHARRVLRMLSLEDCFNGVIDVTRLGFACKPEPEAYRLALEIAGESDPQRCVMLDDSTRNLAPARQMGFTTVLIDASSPQVRRDAHPAASLTLPDLLALPAALPELWQNSDLPGGNNGHR